MMLKTFLQRVERRYALAGALFGTLLPGICLAVDGIVRAPGEPSLFDFSLPTVTALGLMPVFFGVGFYQIGRSKAQLMTELAERRHADARLRHDAFHDRLTGLANRLSLESDLVEMAADRARNGRPALLLLDLDCFKYVNDSMGHGAGDALLAAIARRLGEALSASGRLYRLGGDEFVVTIAGNPSDGKVEDVCRTICALFDMPFEIGGQRLLSGCSIGATFMAAGTEAMGALLERADAALYAAKAVGGSSYRLFDAALAVETRLRSQAGSDLARAVAAQEFTLSYQPVVGMESGTLRAFEARLEWAHPVRGRLSPAQFMPAAARAGLAANLGNDLLRRACREAARWPTPTGLAVDVGEEQIKHRTFAEHVRDCLEEAGLAPGRLTLEVTERIFELDRSLVLGNLAALRRLGVRVALAGFGLSFPGIERLRALPVDQVKLGGTLVGAAADNGYDADLTEVVLKLAQTLRLATAVEGVASQRVFDFFRARGVSEAQGALICPPLSAAEATDFAASAPLRRSA